MTILNPATLQTFGALPPWALRAGAREKIYFDPKQVTAAVVTCGGLCPGLNDVVQVGACHMRRLRSPACLGGQRGQGAVTAKMHLLVSQRSAYGGL